MDVVTKSFMYICIGARMAACKNASVGEPALSSQRAISVRYRQMGMWTRCVRLRRAITTRAPDNAYRQQSDRPAGPITSPGPVPDSQRPPATTRPKRRESRLWENTADNIPRVGGPGGRAADKGARSRSV